MDAPLNEKIDHTLKRKAARKKNDSNFIPVLSLHEQILSLVKEANSKVSHERHVTPRSALIVMNRALASLSSLDDESRDFAVLKDVSRFLNVATKTFTASQTDHADLLAAGHPLSTLNASISAEEFLKKNAQWIAADPSIDESIRPLVASAHAATPGSLERQHAFARLSANKTILASYFKLDNLSAIVAAFGSGNSSAARRARVALQWRDKKGRWVEMGRGVNFRFRLPDGSIQVGKGTYVGAGGDTRIERTSSGASLVSDSGLIEVSGVPGLKSGLYVINSNNAAVYQARVPGYAAPEKPSFKDQLDADIPNLADLVATRRELPIGWKDQGAFYVSDDNYAVIPRNGQPYSVLRMNAEGRPAGDAIAQVRDWAGVNAAITKDEPAFDKEIARLESDKLPLGRIPGADAKDVISAEDLLKMQEQRAQENKAIDAGKPSPTPLGNNDLNGNPVPAGWVRDANNDRNYTREMPLRDGGTYPVIARLGEDGKYIAGHAGSWIPEPGTDGRGPSQKFDTLDAVNKDGLPGLVDYLNGTFTKDNPIESTQPDTVTQGKTDPQNIEDVNKALDFLDKHMDDKGTTEASAMGISEAQDDLKEAKRYLEAGDIKSAISSLGFAYNVIDGLESPSEGVFPNGKNSAEAADIVDKLITRLEENMSVPSGKEIYERRIATGDSLDKVAKDLGIPREEVRRLEAEYGRTLDDVPTPDEPPTPPSGGTLPKTPSPNVPSAPGLFNGFNVPDGAFKLNTASYEPEGKVDEASKDFTDDPKKLATKFTPQDLVQALSQALLGNSTDAALAEILNANVDDNNDMVDPADIQDNVDIPQVDLGSPSGAGQLEFSAGAEFVPAEALFNAIWEAGLDPNRVVANIYDSVNGNNDNLNKLIDAQGGVPSAEEAQLVDDIVQEIRQLKDASAPGDSPVANEKQTPSPDPLPGSLIENIPIDFNNPDYYIPNPESYIPSQPEVDENGYTDNPEILSADYEVADLIEQMLSGITDGSGAALLAFDNITVEVPIEAMRDAIQYQDINTNQILLDLKKESNDMSEPSVKNDSPALQAHSEIVRDLIEQTGVNISDEKANKIRDAIDEKGLLDWSEADNPEIIDAITEVAGTAIFGQEPSQSKSRVSPRQTGDREPYLSRDKIRWDAERGLYTDVNGTALDGDTVDAAGLDSSLRDAPPADIKLLNPTPPPAAAPTTGQRQATESPATPIDSPEAETPQFVYPGPRESGYSANNTVLDSNGAAIGAGSRVQALSDGRGGTVVAVQNIDTKSGRDADYARIRFDDGTTAVRSARQIFGIDAGAPAAQGEGPGQLPPARRNPVPQDPTVRLNEPAPQGIPVIAGNGDIPGVTLADTPQDLVEFTNPDAKQSDYAAWGLRAPEIARAGRDRATIKNIEDLVVKTEQARTAGRNASTADERAKADAEVSLYYTQLKKLVRDTFGIRAGVTLGSNNYTIKEEANVSFSAYNSGEVSVGISFRILDSNGIDIGQGSRSLRRNNVEQPDGTTVQEWSVSNDILVIEDSNKKQSGFAAAYNRYMEDWYIANGFKKIKVHAAGGGRWQGGLVWALNGFIWDGPSQAGRVPAILRKMLNDTKTTEEEKKIIKDMQDRIAQLNPTGNYTPDTVPTPLEIALIGSWQGASKGSSWAGKRTMTSLDWYGVKNLDPAATEQRQAVNYDQMRNARKRIAGNVNRPNISRELVLKTNSNEFADANPELRPYIDYIRDVFRSNRSLAVLSPGAKTALNRFTASQLLSGEDRTVSLQDIIKLRVALDAEFKADNPLASSSNFGVGNQLLDVSMDDVRRNNVPGFTIKELGVYESGVNDTFIVTHNDSGQIFFLKKDAYAAGLSINGPGAEVQADVMLRASGVVAGYETRVSNVDPEVIIMQRAGAGVPLLGEPMTAANALNRMSVTLPDGSTVKVTPQNFMDLLHTPEDAIRVMLVDLIISNVDRHNGNLLLAVDGTDTGKIRILPIDHALSVFSPGIENARDTVLQVFGEGDDNLYGMTLPVLTKRLKQDELLSLFRNEASAMMEGLNNPANLPTGKELDLIISNFGSLDAYREKVQERIDALLQPGGEGHQALLNVLKPSYWSQR